MVIATKKFEVRSSPLTGLGGGDFSLANVSDRNPIPSEEQALKYMYTDYGPPASFDPVTGQFFPSNGRGGSSGDNTLDSGLNFNNINADVIPRISPIDEGQFDNSNGCPYGFYQFGKVCVPDTSINPNSVGSELGSGGVGGLSSFGKGPAKGIILAITPPQFTQLGQEFIVLTDIQNVGGAAAKFYTSISIPDLKIDSVTSNSTLVMPLAKMKIGQRVIMPSSVTASNSLYSATVQLIQIPISYTGTATPTTQIDDTGKVNIPAAGYRGPLPPMGGGVAGTTGAGIGLPPGGLGGGPVLNQPPPFNPQLPQGPATIMVLPYQSVYNPNQSVFVRGSGFPPSASIALQVYNVVNSSGQMQFGSRLSSIPIFADMYGNFGSNLILPYSMSSNSLAIIAFDANSGTRAQTVIQIGGIRPLISNGMY